MKRFTLIIAFMFLLLSLVSCDGPSSVGGYSMEEGVLLSNYDSLETEDKSSVDVFVDFLPVDVVTLLVANDFFGIYTGNALAIRSLPIIDDGREETKARPSSWYSIDENYSLEIPFMSQVYSDGVPSNTYDFASVKNEKDGTSVAIGSELFDAAWEKMLLVASE